MTEWGAHKKDLLLFFCLKKENIHKNNGKRMQKKRL